MRVPTYGAPAQSHDALPNSFLQPVNDDAGRIIGAAAENFGNDLAQAAQNEREALRIKAEHERLQAEAINQAAVVDRKNQYGTFLQTLGNGDPTKPGDLGYFGMSGADALNGRQHVERAADQEMQDLISSATTPRQKLMLERELTDQRLAFTGRVAEHYTSQVPKYLTDTAKAAQTVAGNEAASSWGDPARQAQAFQRLDQAIVNQGRTEGWDAGGNQYAAAVLVAHSKVHSNVLDGLVATDPHAASRYYEAHRLDMTPEDQSKIGPKVVLADKSDGIQTTVRQFMQGTGGPGTTAAPSNVYAAVEGHETDPRMPLNHQVSSAGALGVMQLKPTTARAAARRLAATGDAEMAKIATLPEPQFQQQLLTNHDLNRKLGHEELNYRQGQRGGDLVLALADYNAGPGRTESWIKQYGDPRTGQITHEQWLDKITNNSSKPKTTSTYIKGILAQAGASAAVSTPAGGHTLEDALAYGREKFKNDPIGRDMWEKEALAYDGQLSKIKTDREEQSFAAAQPLFQDPPASRAALYKDPRYWNLDTAHQNQLANAVDEQAKKAASAATEQQRVEAARAGGSFLDPHNNDDVKAVNTDFNARAATWGKLNPADRNARAVAYTRQLGVLPDTVRGWVEGGLRSPDPSQRIAAAALYAQVSAASPGAAQGFHQEDVGSAQFLLHMINSGMTPQQASQLQDERAKGGLQEMQARDQAFTASAQAAKKSGKLDPESFLKTKLGQDIPLNQQVRGLFGLTGAGKSVDVPPQMVGEMNDVARAMYRQTGDYASAMAGAYDVVRRVWAPSLLSGQKTFVKNAPETVYGVAGKTVEQNARWMREQAAAELPQTPHKPTTQLPSSPMSPGGVVAKASADKGEDLVFIEAAGRRGAGGLPVYWVMRNGDYGLHNVTTADGKPALYQPAWGSSPAAKRAHDREVERNRQAVRVRRGNEAVADIPVIVGAY